MRRSLALVTALSLSLTSLPLTAANAAPAGLAGVVAPAVPDTAVQDVQYRRGYHHGPHRGYYGGPRRGYGYYGGPPRGYYRGPAWRGERRYYRGRYWRPANDGWYVYNNGAWVAAAALGLAAGAALGAAAANNQAPASVQAGAPVTATGIPPWSPAWYQYCSRKYKSFNAQTGLYLGYDGKYHYCQ